MMSSSQELPADGAKDLDFDMTGAEPTPHSSQPDPKIQTFPWPRDWIDAPRHRTYRKPNKKSTTSKSQDRKPDTGDNKPRNGQFKEEAKALFATNTDGDAMDMSGQHSSKSNCRVRRQSGPQKSPTHPVAEDKDKGIKQDIRMAMDVEQDEDVQIGGQMDGSNDRSDDAPKLPFGRVPKATVLSVEGRKMFVFRKRGEARE